jgi:hypothetical protein
MDMPPSPFAAVHGGVVIVMNTNEWLFEIIVLRDGVRFLLGVDSE